MRSNVERKPQPAAAFTGFLDLSQARLVAKGGFRLIFEHDDYPGMLVKVLRPEFVEDDGQPAVKPGHRAKKFKFRRRLGAFQPTYREIAEFLSFQAKPDKRNGSWPIAKLFGFVETETGLGLLTEKLTAPNGELAPTVTALVRNGEFSARHEEALQSFFRQIDEDHICMSDINPGNLVFVERPEGGRFVAIDGLGSTSLIPLADWFAWINARRNRRRSRKMWRFIANGEKSERLDLVDLRPL